MGLHLLNISVDVADPHPDYINEDLSFNDQESILEIIAEQILGFEDAFTEYDDPDNEEHSTNRIVSFKINIFHTILTKCLSDFFYKNKRHFFDYNEGLLTRSENIDSPPPQF